MTASCPRCGYCAPAVTPTALTKKQAALLRFIGSYHAANRVTPSFDEMAAALGLRSKSGIHRLVTGLEERGAIRRMAHRARAIEVVPDALRAVWV